MILRTRLTPCLRPEWLAASGAAVLLAAAFLAGGAGWEVPTIVIVAAAAGPVGAVGLIAWFRARALLDRAAGQIWFTCPGCGRGGRPAFRCPACRGLHDDLVPGPYGVLAARCGHLGCGARLPTCGASGRNRLAKVCHRCGHDIPHDAAGAVPEFRVALVGAAGSGKSNLLVTAVWHLRDRFAPANGFEVTFANPDEGKAFDGLVERLKGGYPMLKTFDRLPAVTIAIRSADERSCLLYLFDAAGEHFADDQALRAHPMAEADGIILVVDPWAEDTVARGALGQVGDAAAAANPAAEQAQYIANRLVNAMEQQLASPDRRIHIPVAVVVTKVDAGGVGDRYRVGRTDLGREFPRFSVAADRALREKDRVIKLLHDLGLGNLVQTLEARFYSVGYFAASPLGRSLDRSPLAPARPFEPRGVLPPLVWLCWAMDALGESEYVYRFLTNTHLYAVRCLRGLEGPHAQWYTRITIAAILAAMILFPLPLPTGLQLLYLLVVIPVALLYIILIYILVYRDGDDNEQIG